MVPTVSRERLDRQIVIKLVVKIADHEHLRCRLASQPFWCRQLLRRCPLFLRAAPGTEYLKWGMCINEYGEDAGIFNMNGVESSYGISPSMYRPANGNILDESGELFDLYDINVGNSYG